MQGVARPFSLHILSQSWNFTNEFLGLMQPSQFPNLAGKTARWKSTHDFGSRLSSSRWKDGANRSRFIDFATTTEKKFRPDPSPQHGAEEIRSPAAPKSQPESVDHGANLSIRSVHHKALDRTHQSAHYEWASIQQLVAVLITSIALSGQS